MPSSQDPIRDALGALDDTERDALAHTWEAVRTDGTWPGVNAQRHADVRAALQAAIREETLPRPDRAPHRAPIPRAGRRPLAWVGAIAAGVVLVAVGLGLGLHRATITAPPDRAQTVNLADGSSIELRPGASVTHSRLRAGTPRRVMLTGEAYFTITPGTRFTVETANARIDVLGTQFSVKVSRPDGATEAVTEVYLAEGSVALTGGATEQRVTLAPGDVSHVVGAQAPVAPSAASHADLPLWRARQFTFEAGAPLRNVIAAIEASYDLRVHVHDPALLDAQLPFQYLGRNVLPAPQLLEDLCQILGLTYRPTSDGFEIVTVPTT
ncbi:MAG: FecR domain-containing protein [Bacteroidota bacterium]